MLRLARFLHRGCILAGMQLCPWCLLIRSGAPRPKNPQLMSDRDVADCFFSFPPSSPTLQMHQPAVSCCKKGPCSILMLLAIALATNIDVVFAIAPFHRSLRSLYPWVHLVDSETKANVKQAGWKRGSGLFCSSQAPEVQIIRSGNVTDCHPVCKSHPLICPRNCKTSSVTG